ncbi:YDG/SRA domain-containing protein [Streptomyces synnematoformans]|uniref:YDG/SRA domain-containing protein n=1 Tax=Streptomyces synnematoformans TaxID=415721 RepID=A0ABP5KBN5_9ACTN
MPRQPKTAFFGEPPGVEDGDWFASHRALYEAELHRFKDQGISGTEKTGADSIVLSGGYADDVYGDDEIIYTGAGGRDRDSRLQVADQHIDTRGTAALVVSQAQGLPVRVIQGLDIRRRRAEGGYRYRGLWQVREHWFTIGIEGFRICQFRLTKLHPGEQPAPHPAARPADTPTALEELTREYIEREQRKRDSRVVQRVKGMYDNTCQICGERILVSPTGVAYSEGAHIQALGRPHDGPDVLGNVLCLCPNCHTRFDRGALQLSDSLIVINGLTGAERSPLTVHPDHTIDVTYIRQHRSRWA